MPIRKIHPILLLISLALFLTAQTLVGQSTQPKVPADVHSFDAAAIDKTADPCVDFYQYACGNWLKSNPVPPDQVRWVRSFSLLRERNLYLLWQILNGAAKDPQTPLEKQFGGYYAACMNTGLIEQKGLAPLKTSWTAIDKLRDKKEIAALLAKLGSEGVPDGFFNFGVEVDEKDSSQQIAGIGQGGLSLPDRDYYIVNSPRFIEIRQKYVDHLKKMFTLAGDTPEQAAKAAADVLRIETAMAQGSMSRTELRDPEKRYHRMKVSELEQLTPDFDWAKYFSSIGIRPFDTLDVATPDYFKTLNTLLEDEPVSAWKSYLRWHSLHGQASNLPKAIFDENFAFFGKTLAGQAQPEPRWKQCSMATDRSLGEAVGQDWVAKNFPPQAKASMDKLVAALEKSLGDDIAGLPWMSDETKKAAEEKLKMIRNKIGYPEKWRDYSSLRVDPTDALGNAQRARVFRDQYEFNKLGKPVDEKEWDMTPPTVNAYYDPSFNDINFPAGILQPPFFDFTVDPAVNFGGIGVVIGHELTHGFDDEGSKYDGAGNLRKWQTPEDSKKFEERTECVADEYSGFEAAPAKGDQKAQMLNGHLTLGENTADNGGLRIAYMALLDALAADGKSINDKIDGFTEAQRYFLGFAQVWCQNQTDAIARQMSLVDPHSPGRWRVNGTVQNFDEFGKAFGCKKGQPLYPDKSCRVW